MIKLVKKQRKKLKLIYTFNSPILFQKLHEEEYWNSKHVLQNLM